MARISILKRFLASRPDPSACWDYPGARTPVGYGRLRLDGVDHCAHRVAYELLVGTIPDGLELDHLCRRPPCINPAHLEPVTHAENTARRDLALRPVCKRGHEYAVVDRPDRRRQCRRCRADAEARRRAQARARGEG